MSTADGFEPHERPACPRNDDECSDQTPCASCPHRTADARALLSALLTTPEPLRAATSGSAA